MFTWKISFSFHWLLQTIKFKIELGKRCLTEYYKRTGKYLSFKKSNESIHKNQLDK